MHSYGQNDNVHGIFTYLYIALGVVGYLGCPFVQEMEDEGVKHICFENETPVF